MEPCELYSHSQLNGFFNCQTPYQILDPCDGFPWDNMHEHFFTNQPPFYGISELNDIHNETFSICKQENDNGGKSENVVHSPMAASSDKDSEEQKSDLVEDSGSYKSDQEDIGSKKSKRRAPKGPQFAFKTRSETDLVQDGYKWRKYGKKMIKSSPHPRSYYRCSDKNCGVKKRVERDPSDKTMIITTYEGQHNHDSTLKIYYIGKPIVFQQPGSKPAIVLCSEGLRSLDINKLQTK